MSASSVSSCKILWSTQSGRAKACARRSARILKEKTALDVTDVGSSFDDCTPARFVELVADGLASDCLLLLFVSTTGDGEHCDSIRETWKTLLKRSLPPTLFKGKSFAMFCLGDRAYGPQFCAAGRKLAVRLLQLGMGRHCEVGYGDDNTPNGGVFRDLDIWLEENLLSNLPKRDSSDAISKPLPIQFPHQVKIGETLTTDDTLQPSREEWQNKEIGFADAYRRFFAQSCPITSYSYEKPSIKRLVSAPADGGSKYGPLTGQIVSNKRITASDWEQDTRHIQIHVDPALNAEPDDESCGTSYETRSLSYDAGDIATILPFNSASEVSRFLEVLPENIQLIADNLITIDIDESSMNNSFVRWPNRCTFRGWLKYCADIHSLPEREDLRAIAPYCSEQHERCKDQMDKLISLSETSEAALYADYILREKRSWADVFFDFDALRTEGSRLTIEALLVLLPPIRPRHFSIASAPSTALLNSSSAKDTDTRPAGFSFELCVAVVEGTTPLGRSFHGLCSEYLSRLVPEAEKSPPLVQLWIRPGSFSALPLELSNTIESDLQFERPILCVGAGTGIAPLRSLIQEREAVQRLSQRISTIVSTIGDPQIQKCKNILVFGCRKERADFYYNEEWKSMCTDNSLRILTAFSRDQAHKIYVQKVLVEADEGKLIVEHILERNGAVYIAGGPKMARAVKEEIVESLGKTLGGGEKQATQLLNKLQRTGLFSVEAWS